MKRFAYFFVAAIFTLFCLVFFTWNYLPYWVSNSLSNKMGVPVSIAHFNFTPRAIDVYKTTIGNPKGYVLSNALTVDSLEAKTPLSRFFKDTIVLDEVKLSDVYLGLEFDSMLNSRGNWSVIMNNLSASLNSESSKGSKNLLIKSLIIKNLQIDLIFKNDNKGIRHLKPIPLMAFNNISGEGGPLIDQLTNIVISEILKEVFSINNLKNMLNGILRPSSQGISPLYNSLKSLFSQETEFNP